MVNLCTANSAVLTGAEHAQSILSSSGVKASHYDKLKGEFMCRELAALNAVGGAEHAQWILLSLLMLTNTRASLCTVSTRL